MLEFLGLSIEFMVFLFLVAIAAGLIDTLAGGGGLLVLPALILSGIPPLAALGTNKLQGTMGTATSTFLMFKHKRITWTQVKWGMLSAFVGAVIGTVMVQFIDAQVLSFIIPLVLLLIGVFFMLSPAVPKHQGEAKLSAVQYSRKVVPFIGAYDGMFGPGTGSFFAMAGVHFRALGLIDATAQAKSLNFSTNIASLMVFIIAGQLVWSVGVLMMCGQLIGAWMGARYLYVINPKYIKAIVVCMCFSMLAKYVWSFDWTALDGF